MQTKLKDKNFVKLFKRPYAIQRQEGLIRYNARFGLKDILIIPFENSGVGYWYAELSQIKEVYSKVSKIFEDKNKFKEHIDAHLNGKKEILNLLKEFSLKQNPTKEELLESYRNFNRIMNSRFAEAYSVPFAVETFAIKELRELLKKELKKEDIEQEWEIVTLPTQLIELQKLRIQISKLFLNNKLEENMDKLQKQYSWITIYGPGDKPANLEYIRALVLGDNKESIEKGIEKLESNIKSNKERLTGLLSKINNNHLKNSIENLNFYITFRNDRMDTLRQIIYHSNIFYLNILKNISKEGINLDYNEIINFTIEEIIEYLSKDKLPKKEEIKERINPVNYHYYSEGKFSLIIQEYEKEILSKKLNPKREEKINEFNGTIACNGFVRGTVKIISNIDDLNKLNYGDILVSDTTDPSYVIAMDKASAFVTDEGGITCHAAIVARELDKPCITGTEIATKVLKDGDFIEVDAEKGVIRILKRA